MAKPNKLNNGKWRIRWIDENGRRKSQVYCSKADADFKLKEQTLSVQQIKRGLKTKELEVISFNELYELWLKYRTSQKRSPKDDISILNAHLRPYFSKFNLNDITSGLCDRYKLEKSHLSAKTINNHLTLLISMLNYAHDLEYIVKVPKIKKPKIINIDANFRYLKTNREIIVFLDAAKLVSELAYGVYHLAIYSGLRKGEVAGLKWTDIDFAKRLMTVQRGFNKPTKSAETRHVVIVDQNLELLTRLQNQKESEYVFAGVEGKMLQSWHRVFSKDFNKTLELSGLSRIKLNSGRTQKYIIFHSLRHTFASHWVLNGGDIFKLQRLLGHKDIHMTQKYAHLNPNAFAGDFDRFSDKMQNNQNLHLVKA